MAIELHSELSQNKSSLLIFSEDQVELIKRTICAGSTNDELLLFMQQCKRTRLDPFSGQIHAVKRKVNNGGQWIEKMSCQVSIDGLRLIADRTDKYIGQTSAMWCDSDGVWLDVWLKKSPPAAAKVGIYRDGFKDVIVGIARYDSYAQKKSDGTPTAMWAKMPDVMLAKCAEALALRKAFPHEMSGIYTEEEMAQSDNIYHSNSNVGLQEKNIEIDKNDVARSHFDAIEQCRDLEDLKTKYRKALAFAKSCGDKIMEENITELKDSMKSEITDRITKISGG